MENKNKFNGTVYAVSDIGKKRKNNEDAAYCAKTDNGILLLVCDGMGGHRKGEVASKMVVDEISLPFQEQHHPFTLFRARHFIVHHSKKANREIYQKSVEDEEYREMGTTESCALVAEDGTYLFSVGDSRIYSYKKEEGLNQVSKDQSYVGMLFENGRIAKSEMKNHPQRNLLTNAVGLGPNLSNYEQFVLPNDSYDSLLLCTDGLYNLVEDDEILEVLSSSLSTEEKAHELIRRALEAGGNDNVAVILLEK